MDWGNVTPGELVDALREAELEAPRPATEFLSRLSLPKSRTRWAARLKCNAYYYRSSYALLLALALAGALLRRPLAVPGAALALVAVLVFNDPFAAALNDAVVRLVRKVHPHSASLLRSRCTASSTGSLGGGARAAKKSAVRVVGLARPLFVLLALAAAAWLVHRARAWLALLLGLAGAAVLLLAHASLRSPNLKARLASAREEFRAVWRGYQADIAHHDYTL